MEGTGEVRSPAHTLSLIRDLDGAREESSGTMMPIELVMDATHIVQVERLVYCVRLARGQQLQK